MSHVDDGMLHAYLDGALSALDAVRVERHVADCAACQTRLDAARGVIQRAARLLEWASPPADRAAPALAELRPYVAPRWRVPVAWAATIVLALGAGVYGGQKIMRPTPHSEESALAVTDRFAERERDRRAAPITVTAESLPAREVAPPAEPAPGAGLAAGAVAQAKTPASAGARSETEPKSTDTVLERNLMADAAAKARVDTAAALAALSRRQEAPVASKALAPAPVPGAAAQPPAIPRDSLAAANQALGYSSTAVTKSSTPVQPVITTDSARILLGTSPVALPGYPVNSMRVSGAGAVTVEQIVPPGRVIRVIQRRAAANEEQERAASSDLLARYVDGLRVEIMGPMPAESLSVLLGKVRAVP